MSISNMSNNPNIAVVSVKCNFSGTTSPFDFYIGQPEQGHHPVHFQKEWLSSAKGGEAPADWLQSMQELHDMSIRNGVNFKELVIYVMSLSKEEAERIGE